MRFGLSVWRMTRFYIRSSWIVNRCPDPFRLTISRRTQLVMPRPAGFLEVGVAAASLIRVIRAEQAGLFKNAPVPG
jgi:hypothetical protein